MPADFCNFLKEKTKKTWIFSFCASVLLGLIAHGYRMLNWLPNWDSLVFRDDPQQMTGLGRWFLSVASKISTEYELPWLNGLLALFYISMASVLLCEIFEIHSRLAAALLGAVTVTFPCVISTYTYCYVADAYALSFLLSCVAVYLLTRKEKRCAVVAVILLVLSMGIYQAYITVAIVLLLCRLIVLLYTGQDTVRSSWKRAVKYLLCGVCAGALYYAVQIGITTVFHIDMLSYQDVSETFSLKDVNILSAMGSSLYTFKNFFIDFSEGVNLYSVLNCMVFALLAVGYIAAARKNIRKISSAVTVIIYILLIPFGCCVLYFVSHNLDYHTLMKMGFFIVYVFLILLYDKFFQRAFSLWSVAVLCALLVFQFVCIANISYHKLQISFEKSYSLLIRIADRIETTPGASSAKRILVVGAPQNSEDYSVTFPPEITGTTNGLMIRKDDESVGQSVLTSALRDYCDLSFDFIAGEEAERLKASEAVSDMPCWPEEGSVAVKNDIVIVNFGR